MADKSIVAVSQQISSEFAKFYYGAFDSDRSTLASMYRNESILQFEDATTIGAIEIVKKLVNLPFKTVRHVVTTVDGQPTIDGGIIIHVLGQLKTDEDRPHSFSEGFYLKKDTSIPEAPFVILNQVFRLSIHHG